VLFEPAGAAFSVRWSQARTGRSGSDYPFRLVIPSQRGSSATNPSLRPNGALFSAKLPLEFSHQLQLYRRLLESTLVEDETNGRSIAMFRKVGL